MIMPVNLTPARVCPRDSTSAAIGPTAHPGDPYRGYYTAAHSLTLKPQSPATPERVSQAPGGRPYYYPEGGLTALGPLPKMRVDC